jgi:ribosomal protein L37E
MAFKCVSCEKPLYNRRRKTCEFCGAAIPESLRLSAKQQAFIQKLKVDEAKQHRDGIEAEVFHASRTINGYWF